MTTWCAAFMVKNEEAALPRAFDAALDAGVTHAVVLDTGSSDGTLDVVETWRPRFAGLLLVESAFDGFAACRNRMLDAADGWLPASAMVIQNDADETLVGSLPHVEDHLVYDVTITGEGVSYACPYATRVGAGFRYAGATHEWLDGAPWPRPVLDGVRVVHHADGGARADKWTRDEALLRPDAEAGDTRAMFYLAVSLRGQGRHEEAAEWFARRAQSGGWDEEAFVAAVYCGDEYAAVGDMRQATWWWLSAGNYRPQRPEPWRRLSRAWGGAVAGLLAGPAAQDGAGDRLFVEAS